MKINELAARFDPADIEARWAKRWSDEPYTADPHSDKPAFTIVMPPPNVTGDLHLGHAFDNVIIDTLVRYRRMRGDEALFQPGSDHAGIATQVVVERQLREQGISRHDLGREEFLRHVWAWKEESGGAISAQLRRMGISADWTRDVFTMDEGPSRAVRKQFVDLYHQGKIFRSERIINWDPESRTTLSDLEVDREERQASMYTLAYAIEGGGEVLIATVRPETIFADTAVAVHPDDDRFSGLVGKRVRIPLTDRFIPVITDQAVERDFGTGALKITPAHDPTDFEIGERHGLPHPSVIGFDARMSGELVPERFRGLDRFEARPQVVSALQESGALRETRPHTVSLGISSRTGQPVEPMIMLQWFYDTSQGAARALAALDDGTMRVHPERYAKVNRDWLSKLRPWNISRQLWWGHRVPAWYDEDGNIIVPDQDDPYLDPTDDPRYSHLQLTRDEDVFDTWFSSNLWPFSTMGWPDGDDAALDRFYPNSVLSCGYDILFFWVARMQIAGFDLTGQAPFSDVLLHGLILDAEGQKMSKSRGNGVDPLLTIERYGADALRFALCHISTGAQDLRWDERRVEMGRNFATKLWNAARFGMMNLEGTGTVAAQPADTASLGLSDRWMLSRLERALEEVAGHLDALELGLAARAAYDFVWSEFCDWYLEAAKPGLKAGDPGTRQVLAFTLESVLKMLHSFMPFVTSELWVAVKGQDRDLGLEAWPELSGSLRDPGAEREFAVVMDAVGAVRSLKSEAGLAPGQVVPVQATGEDAFILAADPEVFGALARARLETEAAEGPGLSQPTGRVELRMPLDGLVDLAEWRTRQEKRLETLVSEVARSDRKLSNPGFVAKAPAEVVQEERRRLEESRQVIDRLRGILEQLD